MRWKVIRGIVIHIKTVFRRKPLLIISLLWLDADLNWLDDWYEKKSMYAASRKMLIQISRSFYLRVLYLYFIKLLLIITFPQMALICSIPLLSVMMYIKRSLVQRNCVMNKLGLVIRFPFIAPSRCALARMATLRHGTPACLAFAVSCTSWHFTTTTLTLAIWLTRSHLTATWKWM